MHLPSKLQKHQAFVSELEANENRIDGIKEKGRELIDANHYAKDAIEKQLNEIDEQWSEVKAKSTEKGKFFTKTQLSLMLSYKNHHLILPIMF